VLLRRVADIFGRSSVPQDSQVELPEALGVSDHVNSGDLSARESTTKHQEESARGHDHSHGSTVGPWLSTSGAQHTVAAEGLQQILLDTLMPRLSQDARKLAPARGRGAEVRARRSR
jgi:hypothetical protein